MVDIKYCEDAEAERLSNLASHWVNNGQDYLISKPIFLFAQLYLCEAFIQIPLLEGPYSVHKYFNSLSCSF